MQRQAQLDARPLSGGGGGEHIHHAMKKASLVLSRHAEQRRPMPRLRVVAGSSLDALVPITVNSGVPHAIVSDAFEGQIIAYIKDFPDDEGNALPSEYFDREDRKGVTWSIQVQGRFLRPVSADDVLFGNTFDRPLKLPWGSSAALKFMHFIDPTLEHDLASSTKPWALSPLISTMPYLAHRRVHVSSRSPSPSFSSTKTLLPAVYEPAPQKHAINHEAWPLFPPLRSLSDDSTQLYLALKSRSVTPSRDPSPLSSRGSRSATPSNDDTPAPASNYRGPSKNDDDDGDGPLSGVASLSLLQPANRNGRQVRTEGEGREEVFSRRARKRERELRGLSTAAQRRAYFRDATRRRELIFGPEDLFTIDFCYGFIQFTPTLALNLPGGISFDLMRYWDGQPVRFVCCERKRENEDGEAGAAAADPEVPWGRVLWSIAIGVVAGEGEQPQPNAQLGGPRPPNAEADEAAHQPHLGDDGGVD